MHLHSLLSCAAARYVGGAVYKPLLVHNLCGLGRFITRSFPRAVMLPLDLPRSAGPWQLLRADRDTATARRRESAPFPGYDTNQ